jgi:hypothetical protein
MTTTQSHHQGSELFATDAHNAHGTSTGRCGNGNDGRIVL